MKRSVPKTPVEALRKGLDILDLLAARFPRSGAGLGEIAQSMSLRPSTAHNLVKTLRLCGYVRQNPDGRYSLGWKALSLRNAAFARIRADGPTARALANHAAVVGEALVLVVLIHGRRWVVGRAGARQAVRVDLEELETPTRPFWTLVTNRLLAAFAAPDELEEIIARQGRPGPEDWPEAASPAAFENALAQIRAHALAEDRSADVASVAVPAPESAGRGVLAALGSFLPAYRWTGEKRKTLTAGLRAAAAEIGPVLESEMESLHQGPIPAWRPDDFPGSGERPANQGTPE